MIVISSIDSIIMCSGCFGCRLCDGEERRSDTVRASDEELTTQNTYYYCIHDNNVNNNHMMRLSLMMMIFVDSLVVRLLLLSPSSTRTHDLRVSLRCRIPSHSVSHRQRPAATVKPSIYIYSGFHGELRVTFDFYWHFLSLFVSIDKLLLHLNNV